LTLPVLGFRGRKFSTGEAAPMLDPLAKAVSDGLILFLGLHRLVLFLVSLRKEFTFDRGLHGLFPLALYVTGLSF
jgi:hypothetical protein